MTITETEYASNVQEIRGLLRELLSQTLIVAAKSDSDTAYELNTRAEFIRLALTAVSDIETGE